MSSVVISHQFYFFHHSSDTFIYNILFFNLNSPGDHISSKSEPARSAILLILLLKLKERYDRISEQTFFFLIGKNKKRYVYFQNKIDRSNR